MNCGKFFIKVDSSNPAWLAVLPKPASIIKSYLISVELLIVPAVPAPLPLSPGLVIPAFDLVLISNSGNASLNFLKKEPIPFLVFLIQAIKGELWVQAMY